jgi:hypothetical protein
MCRREPPPLRRQLPSSFFSAPPTDSPPDDRTRTQYHASHAAPIASLSSPVGRPTLRKSRTRSMRAPSPARVTMTVASEPGRARFPASRRGHRESEPCGLRVRQVWDDGLEDHDAGTLLTMFDRIAATALSPQTL